MRSESAPGGVDVSAEPGVPVWASPRFEGANAARIVTSRPANLWSSTPIGRYALVRIAASVNYGVSAWGSC